MSERIRSAARELLPAIGYGDAAGLPFETKSAAEITEYGGVSQLQPIYDNSSFFDEEWVAGMTSDDTQLSVAVAESLIESGGFSLQALGDYHIAAYNDTPRVQRADGRVRLFGWGRSTTESVERMAQGMPPEISGQKGAPGNGVVMKIAPLAIWQALIDLDTGERHEQYDELTTMTHDSDIARLCTRIHGDVLSVLLHDDRPFGDVVRQAASVCAADFPDEAALLLRAVTAPCRQFEQLVERYAAGKTGKQYGFYVPETLAITYDIMLGSGGDFERAVYWAVNLGGDCDSTASIVASMIACASGGAFEKPNDMAHVQDYDQLVHVSEALARS